MYIPEVISNFNVYDGNSKKVIGVSAEVTLPEFATASATISGAGMLGEIDVPVPGQFGSMEQEIPFNNLYQSLYKLYKVNSPVSLALRGSMQVADSSNGSIKQAAVKVTEKGYAKKITGGKLKAGESMGSALTMELTYIHIEIDGKSMIKLDKLNNVFEIEGKDQLAAIKKNC